MAVSNPLIVAIDTPDVERAKRLAEQLEPHVGLLKLGLEFFMARGGDGVRQVQAACDAPLFLDLKLHDIPNTVAGAVQSLSTLSPAMLTVHASGGREMMKAAVTARNASGLATKLLAVTVLTSLDADTLEDVGVRGTPKDQVLRLAELAAGAGIEGCVCSPHEVALLKNYFRDDLTLVVPGIRPEGSETGDQKRIMTPKQALEQGADYIVVGRPITQANDPAAAAEAIAESL